MEAYRNKENNRIKDYNDNNDPILKRFSNISKEQSQFQEDTKKIVTITEAWNELKSSPRELYFLFFLKFLESYSYFAIIYTLIIFLSDEYKYTDEQAGWSYGIFGMCTTFYGFVFGGFVIDNLGVKLSLTLGSSILLLGRVLLVICTQHVHILIILYTILPIGTCLGIPVMQIGIRRFTTEKCRSLAFSIFYGMMNVSAIFSASAIDFFRKFIADEKILLLGSFNFELTAYRALFLSGACTTLLSLLISIFLIKEVEKLKQNSNNIMSNNNLLVSNEENEFLVSKENINNGMNTSDSNINTSNTHNQSSKNIVYPCSIINELTAQKSFWKFVCVIILLMGVRIVYRHLDATFPKYMIREFGKDVMYGSIIAINPFLIVILIPLFAPLSYQFSAYSQITFGAFITSLSPFFLVSGPHLWSSIMFVVILSIGEALWSPRLYEYTIFITEEGREGMYMALASSPMFVATLITGATSGVLLESFCPETGVRESWKMWLLIGCITLTSPILLYLFKQKIEVTKEELTQERSLKAEKEKLKQDEIIQQRNQQLKKENIRESFEENVTISKTNNFNHKDFIIDKQEEFSFNHSKNS